jgi:hypothetical protein
MHFNNWCEDLAGCGFSFCSLALRAAVAVSRICQTKCAVFPEETSNIILIIIIIIIISISLPSNLAETISADVRLLKLVFVNACLVAAGVSYLCFLILVSKNVPAWMFRFFVWCVLLR